MGTLVFQATLGGAVNIIGPNIANTINFTLPSADGTSGQTWTTNGSGLLTFGTLGVAGGGTGLTTLATGSLSYGAGTSAFSALAIGSAGQVLTVNSGATAPQWSTLTGVAVTTFSAGTTGFTPSSATSGAITLSGTLVAANGGTGQSSYAVGDLLYASTTTALSKLADVATGNALISGGVGVAPSWGKIGLTTHVSGTLPTANGGTNLTSFTSGGVVYASSSSALATGSGLIFDGTNLGLGGTPSASSLATIQSSYGITIGNNEAHTTKNAYYNSGWKYATTTTAARFSVGEGGSDFRFYTAASGTAGNAITFTQAMTLDASGNLGIGTSSPDVKLSVVGDFTLTGGTSPTYPVMKLVDATSGGSTWVVSSGSSGLGDFVIREAGVANWIKIKKTSGNVIFGANIGIGDTTPTTSGTGITFPATQSASSNANTLDDYEEGTWTPSLGGTATYTRQEGNYTKIGRLVTIRCNIEVLLILTGSTYQISGLPFTTATTPVGNPPGNGVVGYFGSLAVSPVYISTICVSGGTTVNVSGLTAAGATASSALGVFGNSARVDFTMTYYVD